MSGYYGSVLIESLGVGAVLAALLSMAVVVYPTYDSPSKAAFLGFVLGMLTHVVFEASKANRWYCKHGAACASQNTS